MKALYVVLFGVLALAACDSSKTAETRTAAQTTPTYEDDQALFVKASQNLVDQFSRNLKSELMDALNSYGPPYALQVCQIKAPQIAASHTKGGWSIKRVSERFRNPDDRPIGDESTILARFADSSFHQDYYQDWYGSDSARVFRYCQKIMVQPMCLQCHGDLQTMDPDLFAQIKTTYPWDRSLGFKTGDLRGMFVVEASWPQGRDVANLLASGVDIKSLDSATTDTETIPFDTTEDTTTAEGAVTDGQG